MRLCKKIAGYLFFCFPVFQAIAQQPARQSYTETYKAIHYGAEEGLSGESTWSLFKSTNSFAWIGSFNGLNRFDGNTIKVYQEDTTKSNSLLGNNVFGIVEDSLHNIWIGTDRGLSRYDSRADTFSRFTPGKGLFEAIIPFWSTEEEVLCLERGTNITAYNTRSYKKRNVTKLSIIIGNSHQEGVSIFDKASNSVWMLPVDKDSLIQVSLSSGETKVYGWPCFKKIPTKMAPRFGAEAMVYDGKRNCIWINSHDGLIQFSLPDKQFRQVQAFQPLVQLKEYDRWVGIDIDVQGRIWLATLPKGILIYNPTDSSVKQPFPDDPNLQDDISEGNMRIKCSRDGTVWLSYWLVKGFYQLKPFPQAAKRFNLNLVAGNPLYTNIVEGCYYAGGDKIWMTTALGVVVFDVQTNRIQKLRKGYKPDSKVIGGIIQAIDTVQKKAWIEEDGQLYEVDIPTLAKHPVTFNDSAFRFVPKDAYRIIGTIPYKDGCMIRLAYNKQFHFFSKKKGSFIAEQVLVFPREEEIGRFGNFYMDDRRLFLFNEKTGTTNTYVEKNGKWGRVQTPLDSFKATVRYYNQQDGTYWLGGEKQLLHLNKDFRLIRGYTQKDGLPGDFDLLTFNTHSLTNAHYILSDNKNNIWFTTNGAVYELDVRQGKFYRLQDRDGFEKQVFTGSIPGKDQSGNLYFPGGFQYGQGFDKIIPDNLRKSYPPSIAYIQSLQVNQEQKILEEGPDGLAKLSLKYSENRLVIETGIIDFFSGGKSGIRYKIKELNDDWQYAPANYTIRYEGLQSGRYTLVMQASNALNEFIGPEKRVRFVIHPPFWKTWWAYTGYALLLIVGTWAFMHYRSRRLLRTNQLLEEKVTQRTKQLKKSLEELKATQTQLIQREKMASLGELTAGIAHEIQNPLNFVNNFSEVSEELVDELKEEIINGNKEEAICLTDDIKANLKKVVNHGKRADAIVKSMLEHSRTGDGQKEAIDINALADEYIRLAYHGMRAKDKAFHAHFTTDFDSTIDKIEVVPQEIGRVLLNLFNNAFYAVNQKKKQLNGTFEPVVSVRTKQKDGKLVILVEDNGTGIPQSDLKKLYNPFFTTKPTGEGTGLGLSLSYDIITKGHKGEMKVDAKEGEGATFIISLPINNRI